MDTGAGKGGGMMYPYSWSINISIYPNEIIHIIVWKGQRKWEWSLRRPFRIETGLFGEPKHYR